MAHILIITAHPNPNGYTHTMANHITNIAPTYHHTTTLMNLYDSQWRQEYLDLTQTNKHTTEPHRTAIQKEIQRADCLIFLYPLWWFDAPAILKNRYDPNLTPGFAYNYRAGKIMPEKLLESKRALYVITAGGPARAYKWLQRVLRFITGVGRMGYVGIQLHGFRVFGGMHTRRSEKERMYILQYITRRIAAL